MNEIERCGKCVYMREKTEKDIRRQSAQDALFPGWCVFYDMGTGPDKCRCGGDDWRPSQEGGK